VSIADSLSKLNILFNSYETSNATIVDANYRRGLYTICVQDTQGNVNLPDKVVYKYEHEFSSPELLLQYWAKRENAVIWRGDHKGTKICNMARATYATNGEVRASGELAEDQMEVLPEINIPADFEVLPSAPLSPSSSMPALTPLSELSEPEDMHVDDDVMGLVADVGIARVVTAGSGPNSDTGNSVAQNVVKEGEGMGIAQAENTDKGPAAGLGNATERGHAENTVSDGTSNLEEGEIRE
jgi:hypothetical protein